MWRALKCLVWNVFHDDRDRVLLIAELRRALEASRQRESCSSRERDRWQAVAGELHDQIVKTFCWHCGIEWTRDYRVDEAVASYRQTVVDGKNNA